MKTNYYLIGVIVCIFASIFFSFVAGVYYCNDTDYILSYAFVTVAVIANCAICVCYRSAIYNKEEQDNEEE